VLLVPPGADWRLLAETLATSLTPLAIELALVTTGKAQMRHDLALQDHVARVPDALAFLARWRCGQAKPCSLAADQQLAQAAQTGSDLPQRLALAAAVEQELLRDPAFVPLLRPVRWALVSRQLTGFETNMLGRHPVARIAAEN
jgi:oligopeptide transport system substrate-binding protein